MATKLVVLSNTISLAIHSGLNKTRILIGECAVIFDFSQLQSSGLISVTESEK